MLAPGRCLRFLAVPVLATALLAGCNQLRDRAVSAAKAAATSAARGSGQSRAAEPALTPGALTLADVDLYEQLTNDRIAAFHHAIDRTKTATSAMDTIRVVGATAAEIEDSALAARRGVTVQHLQDVASLFNPVMASWVSQVQSGALGAQLHDTATMPPDARANARSFLAGLKASADSSMHKATAGMPPDVVTALLQRRPLLDSLQKNMMVLTLGH